MKTILIVDDTKNIRLLLSKTLANEGYSVYQAKNAIEALSLIKTINFDLAFIDIKMPNISGTALLEQIRQEGFDFPVIIMTAFGTIKNAITTTNLGAKAYLQKPFTGNTIRKTLDELFCIYADISDEKVILDILLASNNLPKGYLAVSDYLTLNGQIEKGKLFKDFGTKLLNIKE
ncbi:response regulator [uncultured Clostridium sp.]|uniref:response regulator n=1 Tax=uncultured Clostridium sp. TaxID=59620 RepID=UPI002624E2FA|nr:response regulator [uncultured Clostridium sp.]